MSLGDADAKFPGQAGTAIPPSPTRENPAAVYPKSSTTPAPPQEVPGTCGAPSDPRAVLSNPYAFDAALEKLQIALDEVIREIGEEASSAGVSVQETSLSEKFRGWRRDLDAIRGQAARGHSSENLAHSRVGVTQEGGMFVD